MLTLNACNGVNNDTVALQHGGMTPDGVAQQRHVILI